MGVRAVSLAIAQRHTFALLFFQRSQPKPCEALKNQQDQPFSPYRQRHSGNGFGDVCAGTH